MHSFSVGIAVGCRKVRPPIDVYSSYRVLVAIWVMGSHSVTCHTTQVNTPHRNSSQPDLPIREGWKAELT